MAVGKPARHAGVKDDLRNAQGDQVAVVQPHRLCDAHPVDEGAVGAAQIRKNVSAANRVQPEVMA